MMVKKEIEIMGGSLFVEVTSKQEELAEKILEFSLKNLQSLVDKLNFFDENSLLFVLNESGSILYDEVIADLLEKSSFFYDFSKGRFNIFLGNEILKRKNNLHSDAILEFEQQNFVKFIGNKIFLLHEEVKIDFGGIAKGYILDETLKKLKQVFDTEKFSVLFDARGDILVSSNDIVEIEVENPFEKGSTFEYVKLKKGSIITSGHNRQVFRYGSHIVGKQSNILSVTLVSDKMHCYELDALGTCFSLMNSENVLELVEFNDYLRDVEALIVLKSGKVLRSSFWERFK